LKPRQLKPITGSTVPRGAGGYDFLADPRQRADKSPVFWRVDELASIIILTATTAEAASPAISIADLPDDIMRRDAEDGAHLMVRGDATNHQLLLVGHPSRSTPMVAHRRGDAILAFRRKWATSKAALPVEATRSFDRRLASIGRPSIRRKLSHDR
jgi:hypothetical protein